MINSKLIILFKALDTTQKRQFRKWLESPIHNQHEDVQKLFNLIYSRRVLTELSIAKKQAFKYLYPKLDYNDNRMRHVMSFALETLNNYVRYSYVTKDTFLSEISLARAYQQLNLSPFAEQHLLHIKKQQEEKLIKNSTFFLQNYELEQELFEQIGMKQRTDSTNLHEITLPFTIFFVINTLKYACISQTHSNLRKEAYQIPLLDAVLEEVGKGFYNNIDAVMIYYHSYWALTLADAEKHFTKLRAYLFREQPVLGAEDLKDLYLAALNYCIRKLNDGVDEKKYVREAFDIYKMGLETRILLDENKLSRFAYKNVVALGLRAKEFEWIEQFIPNYAPFVDSKYRDSYRHYNTSKLHFEQGHHDKAMDWLIQVEYDDVFLNLDAKIMLLKIYYSNKNYNALDSLLDSTKVFLGRKSKQVLSYHQENYKNILRFIQKMATLNFHDKKAILSLKNELESTRPLTEKAWLLSCLE